MKLPIVLAVLIPIAALACSTAAPAPAEPTPSIDVTAVVEPTLDIDATVQVMVPETLSAPEPKTSSTTQAVCKLTGWETVQSNWTGKDTGNNSCNNCFCTNGVLGCTKMACITSGASTDSKPVSTYETAPTSKPTSIINTFEPAPTNTPTSVPTATLRPLPTLTQTSEPTATAGPVTIVSEITDFTLESFTIEIGTTIKWIQSATVPHSVTSGTTDDYDRYPDGKWDNESLRKGDSFSVRLNEVGV